MTTRTDTAEANEAVEASIVVAPRVFNIPESRIVLLTEKFAKLIKRATKLGVEVPGFIVTGEHKEYLRAARNEFGEPSYYWAKTPPSANDPSMGEVRMVKHVELTGVGIIKLAGWTFLATLDHELGEDNTIVRVTPAGEGQLPADYRYRGNTCDHCRRAQTRKQTYVVKHEDGRLCQVGSTCIKDFLGHDANQAIGSLELSVMALDFMTGEEESGLGCGATPSTLDLTEYLAWVCKAIREQGWMTRKESRMSGKTATADMAWTTRIDYFKQNGR